MLRIDEVMSLDFESIDFIPGQSVSFNSAPSLLCSSIRAASYFEIYLKTRKTAQTGVNHPWRLYARDSDPLICPVRALIRLAVLYGEDTPVSGPLFHQVSRAGGVLHDTRIVCYLCYASPVLSLF